VPRAALEERDQEVSRAWAQNAELRAKLQAAQAAMAEAAEARAAAEKELVVALRANAADVLADEVKALKANVQDLIAANKKLVLADYLNSKRAGEGAGAAGAHGVVSRRSVLSPHNGQIAVMGRPAAPTVAGDAFRPKQPAADTMNRFF
jgi:hypothetical protein